MADSNSLSRKRWWYLMPVIFITYSLAYLDRANYGFAAAAGIDSDLGITKATSSLIGALFFLGYFFFQVPCAIYAVQRSIRRLIFFSLILWGLCATATGFVSNIPVLMGIRFLLGVVEAAVFPAMLIFISNWFTSAERSRANTLLILGNPVTVLWMSVVSGYLVQAHGWRGMFIIEGLPAVAWAVIWYVVVRDKPNEVSWLNEQEKRQLQDALDAEQRHVKPMRNYGEAMRSKTTVMLCAAHACWCVGSFGFMMWMPTILKSAATMDIVSVGWLSAAPYLVAIIAMLLASTFSDRLRNRKIFVWPPLLIASVAFFISYLIGAHSFWTSYAFMTIALVGMYAPYGPFFAIVPELVSRNVAGVSMGLISSCGALGAFAGSYLVGYLHGLTGSPGASYVLLTFALLGASILMFCVRATPSEDPVPSLKSEAIR